MSVRVPAAARRWWRSPRAPGQLATALAALLAVTVVVTSLLPGADPRGPGAERPRAARPGAGPSRAREVLAHLSLPERTGQLFLAGSPAAAAAPTTGALVRRLHVGGVVLTGRSGRGVAATARVVRRLQGARAAGSPRLLVAADQEGGLVQVLSGPGFSAIPRAIDRRAWGAVRARSAARRWGAQLRRAGVTMDLAPVLDTVPGPAAARRNRPIGRYGRQLGYRPSVVAAHGAAVLRGLADARVAATVKHFPGLGRVAANTDTAAGVTDTRTGPRDAYLRPFRRAVRVGVPAVMVSTARYRRIDPARPAAFSPVVVERLLRHRLGFGGVVVSDDLADARQVAAWPPARRAVRFLRAGGDLVLVADPGVVPSMWRAVLDRARRHPAFRARVDAAALRVLRLKERHGLL